MRAEAPGVRSVVVGCGTVFWWVSLDSKLQCCSQQSMKATTESELLGPCLREGLWGSEIQAVYRPVLGKSAWAV